MYLYIIIYLVEFTFFPSKITASYFPSLFSHRLQFQLVNLKTSFLSSTPVYWRQPCVPFDRSSDLRSWKVFSS